MKLASTCDNDTMLAPVSNMKLRGSSLIEHFTETQPPSGVKGISTRSLVKSVFGSTEASRSLIAVYSSIRDLKPSVARNASKSSSDITWWNLRNPFSKAVRKCVNDLSRSPSRE